MTEAAKLLLLDTLEAAVLKLESLEHRLAILESTPNAHITLDRALINKTETIH